jgi:RND family efflux transporter MFP subunit
MQIDEFPADTGPRVKRLALMAAVFLAVAFVVVWISRFLKDRAVVSATHESATAAPAVDVIEAKPVRAVSRLSLPGQTAAWHASTIYARVNGFVGKWQADIGDTVHKDQVLAVIDTPDLDAQLAAARAQLNASKAQVLARQAEAEFSKTTYDRWRDSPKGVVSEQEREEKHADYDRAVARLKAGEAQVALDEAHVTQYVAMAQFKQVTAPFDGVISERHIDIGNLVTAGSTSSTTPLYVLTQNDPMRVFVDVPQSAAAELTSSSLPVEIATTSGVSRTYSAKITRVSQALDAQSRTMRVEVDIQNPKQDLVPGMYVKVGFGLQPKGAVQVPAAAVAFGSGGAEVATVDKGGRVAFHAVSIARDDGNMVELGTGVSPGDHLVLNISNQILDGDLVRPKLVESSAGKAPQAATASR